MVTECVKRGGDMMCEQRSSKQILQETIEEAALFNPHRRQFSLKEVLPNPRDMCRQAADRLRKSAEERTSSHDAGPGQAQALGTEPMRV
jgi:hypothetical protein